MRSDDRQVLGIFGGMVFGQDAPSIYGREIFSAAQDLGFDAEAVEESLAALHHLHYFTLANNRDYQDDLLDITFAGTEAYAQEFIPNYHQIRQDVADQILVQGATELSVIVNALEQPSLLVTHILEIFKNNKWVELGYSVPEVTVTKLPLFRRATPAEIRGLE